MGPAIKSEELHVLVVDDEIDTREGCMRILSRIGYHVQTSASGEEALGIIQTQPVSLVLLDLKMPGLEGMEVLRRIREIDEKVLVIVITGYATVEAAINAMKLGAYDFIAKPFEPDALRMVVRRAHERIHLTRETEKLDQERRKTLADLGNEKSRTRTIIQSLPTGVVVTNAEGKVVLANPAFTRQFELDSETFLGKSIEVYIDDRGFCNLVKQISRGEYANPERIPAYEFAPKQGKYLLVKGRPIVSEDDDCLGAVITVSDITALKALDRVKSEFVAEVSHELRSPLSTIHEQLALVMRDMAEGKSMEDLPIISRALEKTHELIALIGDLLDLSRVEAGMGYAEPDFVHLEEMLGNIVGFLEARAKKKNQSLHLELPPDPLPQIVADPLSLESIFGNLIVNAIKYTQHGGEIRVTVEWQGDRVSVAVMDNGMGIKEKELEKIFDRFYRIKNEKTRYITGTGLGLPIVKELVKSMNGNIRVESTPGKGSVFTVYLPTLHTDSAGDPPQ
jgi:PAS domain S-box-containing protein